MTDRIKKEGDAEGDKKPVWLGPQPGKFGEPATNWVDEAPAKLPICNGRLPYDKCDKNTLV
jgi:hypothetical protein